MTQGYPTPNSPYWVHGNRNIDMVRIKLEGDTYYINLEITDHTLVDYLIAENMSFGFIDENGIEREEIVKKIEVLKVSD